MADPNVLLLGNEDDVADYRRWQAGRNANTIAPVRAVGNAVVETLASPATLIAGSVLNPEDVFRPAEEPQQSGVAIPPVRYTPGEVPPVRYTPGQAPPVRAAAPAPAPVPANPGGAPGVMAPRTHQEWLDSPLFGQEYRAGLERGDFTPAPSVPFDPPDQGPRTVVSDPGGKPGRTITPSITHEELLSDPVFGEPYRQSLARGEPPITTPRNRPPVPDLETLRRQREAAHLEAIERGVVPSLHELESKIDAVQFPKPPVSNTQRLLARGAEMLSGAIDAAALGTAPFVAMGLMGAQEASEMSPAGDLRYMAFDQGNGPLPIELVGRHKQYLADNPDVAEKLWLDGVLSTPAYRAVQGFEPHEGSLEPMRRAMSTLERRESGAR